MSTFKLQDEVLLEEMKDIVKAFGLHMDLSEGLKEVRYVKAFGSQGFKED
jgi:hypothetical protein